MFTTLSRERDGRVAHVRFDNSDRGNNVNTSRLAELVDALEAASADPRCAVIRLDMAGRNFCSGWDTSSFGDLSSSSVDEVAAALRATDDFLSRVRQLPVPIVAAVRGQVIGFGVGLLIAIHMPVAAESVELSLPEARFGFAPAGVGHVITQALPRAQAYSLLTGAATATGTLLRQWGLVAEVAADDDLDTVVDDLVDRLAQVPVPALRAVVEVVESSITTKSADAAYLASARTIVSTLSEEK